MEQFEIHRKIKQKVQKAAACAPFPRVRSHLRGRRPSPRGTLVAGGGPDRHIVTTPFTVLLRALCRRRAVCGFGQVSGDTYPSLQRHSDEPRGPHALWVPPVRPSLPHSGHHGSCSCLSAPAFSRCHVVGVTYDLAFADPLLSLGGSHLAFLHVSS